MSADPAAPDTGVERKLCLALYAASRAMTGRYRQLLEPYGVTYPQYLVLLVLDQDGRSALVSIGAQLRLESSTLSPLVRRLQTMGLVSRTRATEDERHVSIELTPAGRSRCADLAVVPDQIAAATGLSLAEQSALTQQLLRLESTLRG